MKAEIRKIQQLDSFQGISRFFENKNAKKLSIGGLWGSSQALVCAVLPEKPLKLVLLADPEEAEGFAEDLKLFGVNVLHFPAEDSGRRLGIVEKLHHSQSGIVVSSLLAIAEPVPDPSHFQHSRMQLKAPMKLDPSSLIKKLKEAKYEQRPFVSKPGEFSARGAILDIFPMTSPDPIRLEIFESNLESLRTFDPETQRSKTEIEQFGLFLGEGPAEKLHENLLFEQLREFCVVRIEPLRFPERLQSLRSADDETAKHLASLEKKIEECKLIDLHSLPGGEIDFDTRSVQGLSGMKNAGANLQTAQTQTSRIYLLCRNEAEQKRLEALLRDQQFLPNPNCFISLGSLTTGFRLPSLGASFINHHELMGVTRTRRIAPARRDLPTQVIRSFLDLNEGDLVVHEIHGVGKFIGIQRVQKGQGAEDHLALEFSDEAKLFVPASRIDLVQKYIGAGGAEPRLDKIGSGSFQRRKESVQKALVDLAAELLEIQALRESREGTSYPPDDEMQHEFEEAFPFQETEDQLSVLQDIKHDLESHRPMDRLLCGDVGYGKTELAIRASFKVVAANKQVAVLVPTTILAEQHGQSFRERFADYPVEIASLSRFRTEKEQNKIIEKTRLGKIDILIGTHRLLSEDIGFKDLGLVVIDEEQRFGVRHKEKLKQLRATVDVLTLTATPIPRTLHMALVGIRDISSLTTPPLGRESVETKIRFREDDEFIRQAIRHELNRGGQVFFLHNRVYSIGLTAKHIQDLVPEAKIGVGHGQMPEHELEDVMEKFIDGKLDILVSTSIIESGLDIPRANTILIDHAHLFGLSDLHQLRGRVGRWKHKAHCYLLVPRTEPLPPEARARLKAIEELQDLGSGFAIAMRDLEIRGTGNILGPEQSGHIGAVGYDMYCKLLKATVNRMRPDETGVVKAIPAAEAIDLELGVEAYLSDEYVAERKLRLGLLREFDEIRDRKSRDKAEQALRDRFGPPPIEAKRLLDLFWIKRGLAPAGIRSAHFQEDRIIVEYKDRLRLTWALRPTFHDIRYVDQERAHLIIPGRNPNAQKALEALCKACAHLETAEKKLV